MAAFSINDIHVESNHDNTIKRNVQVLPCYSLLPEVIGCLKLVN